MENKPGSYYQQLHKDCGGGGGLIEAYNGLRLALVCKKCRTLWEVNIPLMPNIPAARPDDWMDYAPDNKEVENGDSSTEETRNK